MQINRLFEMVYLLLEKKKITAKELAERFEVSTRTIYRDVELLSEAKIPVYATKGKGGGICMMEEYVFNKALLSEEEQNQILFALQSMNKIGLNEEEEVLDKMSRMFQKNKNNWIEVDFSDWRTDGRTDHTFDLIKEAILKKQVLKFRYFNSYGQESIREVEPMQIYFKNKSWYLNAYCREKQDGRMFKISRIQDLQVLEEKFEKKEINQIPFKKEFETIHLKLKISKEMAYRVYDEFQNKSIKKDANGDFNIEVTYPKGEWVYSFILSFGEYIEVVEPKEIREDIVEKLQKSIKIYF